jgi:hypothetical protein
MKKQHYSLPEINWLISFPTEEVMMFWIEHDILDSPWLLAHVMLCRALVFHMAKAISKNTYFDIDIALSLTTVYHATRQAADYGKLGKHHDPIVNEFMRTRWDMDYALNQAVEHWFSPAITYWVWNYRINPNSRESGYFPNESLMKEGNINWTEAIPMLTSWLVAWAITKVSIRFQDLRDRRSWEIGKLELPFWKNKILEWKKISLPKPITDIAIKDKTLHFKSEDDIIAWIQDWSVTNEILWKWILDWYEEWANMVIAEYCKICKINDFYKFLESGMDTIWDGRIDKKNDIKKSFERLLGRPITKDEFIPYVDWLDLVFNRIAWLKVDATRAIYQKKLIRIMSNIERVTTLLSKESISPRSNQNQVTLKPHQVILSETIKY